MLYCVSPGAVIIIYSILTTPLAVADSDNSYWEQIENAAEKYPFVAGLLDSKKRVICSGAAVRSRVVLTSARCARLGPQFVVVHTAIVTALNLFEVGSTRYHKDFKLSMVGGDPNSTTIRDNIGVVLVGSNVDDSSMIIPAVEDAFVDADAAPNGTELSVVGYGTMKNGSSIVIQKRTFELVPCYNSEWENCICGFEKPGTTPEYAGDSFLEGAVVIADSKIVGVSSGPCCPFKYRGGEPYNVFTLAGPYLSWIDRLTTVGKRIKHKMNAAATTKLNASIIHVVLFLNIKLLVYLWN